MGDGRLDRKVSPGRPAKGNLPFVRTPSRGPHEGHAAVSNNCFQPGGGNPFGGREGGAGPYGWIYPVERRPRMGPFPPTLGRSFAGVLTDPGGAVPYEGLWCESAGEASACAEGSSVSRSRGASQHAGPYEWIAAASGFRRRNPNSRVAPYGGPGRGWVRGVRGERGREGGEFYSLRKKLSTLARMGDAGKLSQFFPGFF